MKKRRKIIFIILLIILGLGAIGYFLFYQPKERILDETQDGKEQIDEPESGNGNSEDTVTLNSQVHVYMGEDAEQVNDAIQAVEYVHSKVVIRFSEDAAVELATLGTDELFWLDGGEDSPLGDTYIGKIVSNTKENGEIILSTESPMLDEVFDEVYINDEFPVTTENIKSIYTIDGVEITPVSAIPADFMETNFTGDESEQINLLYNNLIQTEKTNTTDVGLGNFIITIDVDLKELLEIKKKTDSNKDSEKGLLQGDNQCKITGKIGVKDLAICYNADWNKAGYGIKELSVGVSGKQVAQVGLDFLLEGEVSGATTKKEIDSFLKIQGLKEKVFPIAYFDCTPGKVVKLTAHGNAANKQIQKQYEIVPFSCGFMVYIDIYGNLSIEVTEKFDYSDEFSNTLILIENGKSVNRFEGKSDPQENFSVDVAATADADTHIGASALLYFFNINVVDVAIVKFGAEIEGKGNFSVSTDQEGDAGFNSDFYTRLYLKVMDVKAAIKTQVKVWALQGAAAFEYEGVLLDLTLAETGQKKDTHYNADLMKWSKMTAEDAENIYYKGTNGKILKEQKTGTLQRKVVYEGDAFSFCGVDQSYLYVLEPAENQMYHVRRINKDGTTSKIILENVKYVLLFKDDEIYYVPADSCKQICKMNRYTLKKEKLCELEHDVEYMNDENGMFFVVTKEESMFSWLFGPDCTYYRISYEGEKIQEYDSDILPQDCLKNVFSEYYAAFRLVTNGYLRETASEVYWLSKDMQTSIETEGVSGWHPTEKGIFTEQKGEDGTYVVVLYQSWNGEKKTITTVSSRTSFFTFVQDDVGNWYFMDQTDVNLELYRMDFFLQKKELIASISLKEIPCDMDECSMEIINNKLFFYTMPEWSKSEVLYRYDLY